MPTDWAATTGQAIERQRERAGLKWASLSERTRQSGRPIHRVALGKIERGERDITVMELVGIAAALGVPPLALLFPDVLDDVAVLPTKAPIRGLAALGWFVGAGGPVGLSQDLRYHPDGVETSDAMRIPLRLLQLELALAEQHHSLAQSENGPNVFTMPEAMRDDLRQRAEITRRSIKSLEAERDRLIEEYRKSHSA